MKRLWILLLLIYSIDSLASTKSEDAEYYRKCFRKFQLSAISFSYIPDSLYAEAHRLMPELKSHGYDILYFSVWEMYIQQLYYNEQFVRAQSELRNMTAEAGSIKNPEALSQVICAQGMLEMYFGQIRTAEMTLRKALAVSPPLDSCTYPRSRLAIYRWLTQTYINDKSKMKMALALCNRQEQVYNIIMKRKRGDEYHRDEVNILGQKAHVLVNLRRLPEAKTILDKASRMIDVHVSPMIYLMYYEGQLAYASALPDNDEALRIATFLTNHFNNKFRPIESHYLRIQAELLMRIGKRAEAATVFQHYALLCDSINHTRVANDLKESEIQYKTHLLNLQTSKMHARIEMYIAILFFLIVLLCISLRFYYRIRHKNNLLVTRIEHIRKMVSEKQNAQTDHTEKDALINKFQIYFDNTSNLCNNQLQLAEIASDLMTNVTYLQKAVREEFDQTLTEYITARRLDLSRRLLTQQKEMSIQEIANKCGFNSLRTYQRQFSSAYDLSPSQYRRTYLELMNQ